jgi:hypothetical protein
VTLLVCGCAAVAVLASGSAGPGAWAVASRCQARSAACGDRDHGDLLPAPLGARGVGGSELRGPPGSLRGLVEHPPQPGRALFADAPVPDGQVRARRESVGPAGQLASAGEAADIPDLGQHHQGGELPRGQDLHPRAGLGVLAQPGVDLAGQRGQADR